MKQILQNVRHGYTNNIVYSVWHFPSLSYVPTLNDWPISIYKISAIFRNFTKCHRNLKFDCCKKNLGNEMSLLLNHYIWTPYAKCFIKLSRFNSKNLFFSLDISLRGAVTKSSCFKWQLQYCERASSVLQITNGNNYFNNYLKLRF